MRVMKYHVRSITMIILDLNCWPMVISNRSHTMDLTRRLLTTFWPNTRYRTRIFSTQSHLHLASSHRHLPPSRQLWVSFVVGPISATVQRDIKISLANWIASSGRRISILEDDGLQQAMWAVLKISNINYIAGTLLTRCWLICVAAKRKWLKKRWKNERQLYKRLTSGHP